MYVLREVPTLPALLSAEISAIDLLYENIEEIFFQYGPPALLTSSLMSKFSLD